MLRDAFYRLARDTEINYQIILAEEASPLTAEAGYNDLLEFEADIAQVVGLIALFVESAGSLAELGAFAALPTVAPSLLAIVDEHYYGQESFIKNGPIRYLENRYGEEWVLSLERSVVGISDDGIGALNAKEFMLLMKPAIEKRLSNVPQSRKFDKSTSGSRILLLVGLCQLYGALTITEIREFFGNLGVSDERLKSLVYCATLLGWLRVLRKGHYIYYVGIPDEQAIDFQLDVPQSDRDKLRWRSDVRQHWKDNDATRFRAISETMAQIRGEG